MRYVPELEGILRKHMIRVPDSINEATGIRIFGKLIKSLAYTTDVAIIKNINANAIIAVYPFTPQPAITHAIMTVADVPVFCGVGGGTTSGKRVINLARDAEFQGAMGVVVNAPTANETIEQLKRALDIPIVVTVVSRHTDLESRLNAGADIFNVSGAQNTASIVSWIREQYPYVPIIATGGSTDESIRETIEAGANAVTYTPPTQASLFRALMEKYRGQWED
ncbi:MAG: hydrolase [Bacillota bacterium]